MVNVDFVLSANYNSSFVTNSRFVCKHILYLTLRVNPLGSIFCLPHLGMAVDTTTPVATLKTASNLGRRYVLAVSDGENQALYLLLKTQIINIS